MESPTRPEGAPAYEPRTSAASAALYEPIIALGERRGMRARRRRLVGDLKGDVLEVGAGTGLNLPHYGSDARLVLAEPEPAMADRMRRRAAELGREAEIVEAPAESLPFPGDSFDAVVCMLVLCTVKDPAAALAEIRRVLRPGGALHFCEHVRADSRVLAAWQDRLRGPWAAFAEGCQCNRPTLSLLGEAGFALRELRREEWRGMPPIVRPLAYGVAVPRLR
ncbi:MAG TPA: class I SAM-dependent methyltransferase [Solirubrobacterales bacterium]